MSPVERTEKMCRACLSTDAGYSRLVPLYSGGCAAYNVPKKMTNVGEVSVREGDGLPSTICQKCVFLVKVADCFKRQIKMADRELRKISARAGDSAENPSTSSDSEIEDLAYNPEYISDEVKAEVEKAFRKKHRMLRDREFEEMTKILHGLDKKQFFPSLFVKKEFIETERSDNSTLNNSNEFDNSDSVEKPSPSNDKSEEFLDNAINTSDVPVDGATGNISASVPFEDSVEHSSRNNLDNQPEDNQSINDENVDPNIIVISDTSDCEASKCEDKEATLKSRAAALSFPLGERKPLRVGNGTNLIEAKNSRRSIRTIKGRKAQPKKIPRTYFLCTSCNIRLRSVSEVLLHHNQVHSPNKASLQCRMCEKTFATRPLLLAHFDQHSETHLFRCTFCPNEFVLKDNLTRHMDRHTRTRAKRARLCSENVAEAGEPRSPTRGRANGDEASGKENEKGATNS